MLGEIIRRNARLFPGKLAFVHPREGTRPRQTVTFRLFDERVNRLVNALEARGVRPGDRLAMLARNCPQYCEVYGAAEKGGRIVVPLNYRLVARELSYLLNDSGASALIFEKRSLGPVRAMRPDLKTVKHLICLDARVEGIEHYEEVLSHASPDEPQVGISRDDVAYIIYTSGTTGLPKGAMLTHGAQYEHAKVFALELGILPADVALHLLPLFHIGGKNFCLAHTFRGATGVIMSEFDPEAALRVIEEERVTSAHMVPTMIGATINLPGAMASDLASLRFVLYAGGPMPVGLLRAAMRRFGRIFCQSYGQTESGPLVSLLRPEEHLPEGTEREQRRLASCGLPALEVDVKIADEEGREVPPGRVGEILVRSGFIMKGYWDRPEESAETLRNGWLHTGDLALADEDGYLYIVDRKKDMIISGGENIYPREVEEVLYTHPAVLEATVIGIPDETWGEAVKAVVVLRPGGSVTEQELVEFCKTNLASYKKPRSVEFLSSLPKNPAGKILKHVLREPYWKGYSRRVN